MSNTDSANISIIELYCVFVFLWMTLNSQMMCVNSGGERSQFVFVGYMAHLNNEAFQCALHIERRKKQLYSDDIRTHRGKKRVEITDAIIVQNRSMTQSK